MDPILKFDEVSKIYEPNHHLYEPTVALDNVSFNVRPTEFVSVVGRSGAGKSTLVKILLAEEPPTTGKVFFENEDVHALHPDELPFLRRRIGTVFQDFKLLAHKTVFENVAFALEVADKNDDEIIESVPQSLELVGLLDKAENFPHELSGGEKQRVALARAMVNRPDVLVADEPTGSLDPINTWEIVRLLLKINELSTTVILATHNKEIVNTLDKRVITLDNGKVIRDEAKGKYIL
jgi:cell division transport system ATP-binding protein